MYKNLKFVRRHHGTSYPAKQGPLARNLYVDGWPNTRLAIVMHIGINQSQVSRLIAKYRRTNDITDRPRPGRSRLSSAADDRVLM